MDAIYRRAFFLGEATVATAIHGHWMSVCNVPNFVFATYVCDTRE